jgi:membrane-associated protease RseP (regulator of RpoE activity)
MKRVILALLAVLTFAGDVAAQRELPFFEITARRAWLGFSYNLVRTPDANTAVVVREIVSASPAERAGLAVGDTILRINGIGATESFIASLGSALSPGDAVRVEVQRGNGKQELTVTAAKPPADYVGLGPTAGLLRVDDDSVRSMVRIFIDSAAASMSELRMPHVVMERRGRPFAFDTLKQLTFIDTVFYSPDSSMVTRFRILGNDSLRSELSDLRMRLRAGDPLGFAPLRDSLVTVYRNRGGNAFVTTPGDSTFTMRFEAGSPFGIMRLGMSAIAGAELTRLDPAMEDYFGVREGVLVVRVPRDTPAARAGLEAGDVIVRVNGKAVNSVETLRSEILRTPGQSAAKLDVTRKRKSVTLELKRE